MGSDSYRYGYTGISDALDQYDAPMDGAAKTRGRKADFEPKPCDRCLVGNHHLCTGVGCYRCPTPHRMHGGGGPTPKGRP